MLWEMCDDVLANILGKDLAQHILTKFREQGYRSWGEFAIWFWDNCDLECKKKVCAAAGIEV